MKYTVIYDHEKGRTNTHKLKRAIKGLEVEEIYERTYDVSDKRFIMAMVDEEVKEIKDPAVIMKIYAGIWMDTEYGEKQLYQIKGGGFIEYPYNLSQCGNCWIHSNAKVFGSVRVIGDAQVYAGTINGSGSSSSCCICGTAEIKGSDTKIYASDAIIAGEVSDSEIYGYPVILDGAKVKDKSKIGLIHEDGNVEGSRLSKTIIGGTVENSWVFGRARVYGEVRGKCTIGVDAVVSPGAEVKGKVVVYNAVINGHVKEL